MFDKLAEKGIHLPKLSIGEYRVLCPECSHTRKKKNDKCLSVTVKSGSDGAVWYCHHCEWTGGVSDEPFRGLQEGQVTSRAITPPEKPKPISLPSQNGATDKFYEWFKVRGISRETVDDFGIIRTSQFFANSGKEEPCIGFPYFENGEVVNVKYRTASKSFRQEKGSKRTLFNMTG